MRIGIKSMIHTGTHIAMIKYITTKEANGILRITLRTLQKHCQVLSFAKIGGHYLLTAVQVEQVRRYMADHPRGRRKH